MHFKDILVVLLIILSSDQLIRCEDHLGSDLSEFSDNLNSDVDSDSLFCSLESNCLDNNSTLKAIHYLKTYGYLPKGKSIDEITTDELSIALIHFQLFSGIERTGRLDQNVIQVMKKKRCDEPDLNSDTLTHHTIAKRRQKRSALGSEKWVPYYVSVPDLTFNWYVVPPNTANNDTNGTEGDITQQIESAAQIWMKIANVTFRHLKTLEESNYKNIIFDPNKVISKEYEIEVLEIPTKFSVASNFKYRGYYIALKPNAKDLNAMLVHIWGHILGLVHSSIITSIMSPLYQGKTEPYLARQDIIDVQTLYGPNPNTPESDILYGLNPKATDRGKTAPNLCLDSKIDSVVEESNGVWLLFKGKHYFQIGPRGQTRNSPRKIVWDFKNFTTEPIDASLSLNEFLFLFSGNEFWKYKNRKFITKRKISEGFVGIPDGPFDDVFRWNVNQKTYFFKGGQFWKYDNKKGKVSDGYPKKVSDYWKGIPDSFDAAISSRTRNQTYFFKDTKYYRFDDINKKVVDNAFPPYPRETEIWFAKCRNGQFEKPLHFRPTPKYEPIPEGALPADGYDDSSYWRGVLVTILVLSLLVSVIFAVLIAYLYFGVLKAAATAGGAGAGTAAGTGAGAAAAHAPPSPKPTPTPASKPMNGNNTTPKNDKLSAISVPDADKTDSSQSEEKQPSKPGSQVSKSGPSTTGANSPVKLSQPKSTTEAKDLSVKSIRS